MNISVLYFVNIPPVCTAVLWHVVVSVRETLNECDPAALAPVFLIHTWFHPVCL